MQLFKCTLGVLTAVRHQQKQKYQVAIALLLYAAAGQGKIKIKSLWAMCLDKCDILGDLATALKRWQGCCTHPCTQKSQETSVADTSQYAMIDCVVVRALKYTPTSRRSKTTSTWMNAILSSFDLQGTVESRANLTSFDRSCLRSLAYFLCRQCLQAESFHVFDDGKRPTHIRIYILPRQ